MATHKTGRPVWVEGFTAPSRPALQRDFACDVCVVGAGIAGLTTAYFLAKEGKSVAVLEDGAIGSGMTGMTTAHLVSALDDRYCELERYHGEAKARLAAESHTAAIDCIERIVKEQDIACGFGRLDGYLFSPPGGDPEELQTELAALRRAGLAVEQVSRAPIEGFDSGPAIRFPRQGESQPLQYLDGLARALERLDGRIFCDTHATQIEGGDSARVLTRGGPIVRTQAIVVATNVPINDLVAIHTKQAPYTTYVIAAELPAGGATRALYWDTRQSAESRDRPVPYHYVRIASRSDKGELLIVGGEDHKTGQEKDADERFARLEEWARQRWPRMGNGMTHGTIAGLLLTDMIGGRSNAWEALYDPSRITLRAAGAFVRESVNVAAQYAKGYLSGADAADEADVAPGEGALIKRGLIKVAVYRDSDGAVHRLSAICPHLGCIVEWNPAERTWDCPCHGSRFDALGRVINGPANRDLQPASYRRAG